MSEGPRPKNVVLLLSDKAGRDAAFEALAASLAKGDTLVVGVDTKRYLAALSAVKDACMYPAGDLEALSQMIQKKLDLPTYAQPVLVGVGDGGVLAYAAMAQGPSNTFRAGVGLGFCPQSTAFSTTKPLCKGTGLTFDKANGKPGVTVAPTTTLEAPFVVLHGENDKTCDAPTTTAFTTKLAHGKHVDVPAGAHAWVVTPASQALLQRELASVVEGGAPKAAFTPPPASAGPAPVAPDVSDLPLVEVPPTGAKKASTLVVLLSGDGGWASIDKSVAGAFADKGYPVVGVDCLKYFWSKKIPEVGAKDLERTIRHYLVTLGLKGVLLVGYSRGADVLPALATRMPADVMAAVKGFAFLGLSSKTTFEFRLSDWLGSRDDGVEVYPDVLKLKGRPMVCVYGEDEKDTLCPRIATIARSTKLKGGHHFDGDYEALADLILAGVPSP